MKKKIGAILLTAFLVMGIIPIGVKAEDNPKYPVPSKEISTNGKTATVYPSSSQWACVNGKWKLATTDFQQAYANVWVSYEGKWYYIDDDGFMAQNEILRDDSNSKYYYLSSDGSMLTNNYVFGLQPGLLYANADGSLIDSNGSVANNTSTKAQANTAITIDQAKKIALDKVKAITSKNVEAINKKYPELHSTIVIVSYIDSYEKNVDGRDGYIIPIGSSDVYHTVVSRYVFVDKNTGDVFDATNVVYNIEDSKLKELT